MKINILRLIRVILAVLVFSLILLFFCDFARILPVHLHGIMQIQLVPALMAGNIAILIGLFILAILFGRIYCSVICPLGILQDIFSWFTKRGKEKNRKKRWFKYSKPLTVLRYTILFICAVILLLGISTPLLLLDPYSNFGRIAVNLFRPLVMEGNNLLNIIALKLHIYKFYFVTVNTFTVWTLVFASVALLTVGIMSLLRGRLYCNTICPVGSLLGLISRFSFFKIMLNDSKCTSCGLCEKACKSQCINSKDKIIDYSRCVVCFDCLKRCKSDGVNFRFAFNKSSQKVIKKELISPEITSSMNVIGMNRRSFLVTSTAIAASLPACVKTEKALDSNLSDSTHSGRRRRFRGRLRERTGNLPISPPGSISLDHFEHHCTACHLCITHCPQQILKPAGFDYGITYAFKPEMIFYEKGFCNYECTVCSEVCPNGAIRKLSKEEKKITQVGIASFRRGRCIVFTENTACGACSEHCPTQAVRMVPYINGITIPHVDDELCIGCGGCESICPVRPHKAIFVIANEVHQKAEKPPEGEMLQIDNKNLDFGF